MKIKEISLYSAWIFLVTGITGLNFKTSKVFGWLLVISVISFLTFIGCKAKE